MENTALILSPLAGKHQISLLLPEKAVILEELRVLAKKKQ